MVCDRRSRLVTARTCCADACSLELLAGVRQVQFVGVLLQRERAEVRHR